MQNIVITISPDGGSVTVEANEFVGESCKDATRLIIEAIGTLEEEVEKPEIFLSYLPGEVVNSNG